jgi:hypothetical protein
MSYHDKLKAETGENRQGGAQQNAGAAPVETTTLRLGMTATQGRSLLRRIHPHSGPLSLLYG